MTLSEWQTAKSVFIYCSVKDEFPTDELLQLAIASGKKVYVPYVVDTAARVMVPVRLRSLADLVLGEYAIPTSKTNDNIATRIDLAVVPGVLFTAGGKRLGYGGGYYDRFLARYGCYKVGLCYSCQIADDLPTDKHDVLMDKVIYQA